MRLWVPESTPEVKGRLGDSTRVCLEAGLYYVGLVSCDTATCKFWYVFVISCVFSQEREYKKITTKINPDLWHLRHWLQLWQLRTCIQDNLYYLTIKSDTGQHLQFLRCLLMLLKYLRITLFGNLPFQDLSGGICGKSFGPWAVSPISLSWMNFHISYLAQLN